MGFTAKSIKALRPGEKPYRTYEGDGNWFGVQVTPKGTKTFFQAYVSPATGKRRFATLGRVENISLAEARDRARSMRDLVQQGCDPQDVEKERLAAERRRQEEEAAQGTVQDLVDAYVAHMEEQGKSSAGEVRRVLEREAVPVLGGGTPAKDVAPRQIAEALHQMIARGVTTQANRMRSYIYSAFRHGQHHDNDPMRMGSGVTFALERNPVDAVPRNPAFESAGDRELSWDELALLWHRAANYAPKLAVLYFRLVLATGGQRVAEYLRATWAEMDFEQALWTIPAAHTKNSRIHVVPLTDTALAVLDELQALTGDGHLFPSPRREGPVQHAWAGRMAGKIQAGDGMAKWKAADMRRTWKTRAGEAGLSKDARDRVQNHALTDVSSQHYDRYDYLAEKRDALETWERALRQNVIERRG